MFDSVSLPECDARCVFHFSYVYHSLVVISNNSITIKFRDHQLYNRVQTIQGKKKKGKIFELQFRHNPNK